MSNELLKKDIIDNAPAFFTQGGPTGMEDFDNSSVIIPFLRVVQPLSDVPEGVNMGDFFNSSAGKSYGKSIRIICIGYTRSFIHRSAGEGKDSKFLGTLTPEQFQAIEHTLTKDGGKYLNAKGEKYSDCRNHFVLNADDLDAGIMLWTMESTGVGVSRAWNSKLASVKVKVGQSVTTAPIYAKVWEMSTVKIDGEKGKYYAVDSKAIKDGGWITAEDYPLISAAFNEVQELKGKNISMVEPAKSEAVDSEEVPF